MSKENKPKLINMAAKLSKAEQVKLGKEENFGHVVPKAPPLRTKPPKMQRMDVGQSTPTRLPSPSKTEGKK